MVRRILQDYFHDSERLSTVIEILKCNSTRFASCISAIRRSSRRYALHSTASSQRSLSEINWWFSSVQPFCTVIADFFTPVRSEYEVSWFRLMMRCGRRVIRECEREVEQCLKINNQPVWLKRALRKALERLNLRGVSSIKVFPIALPAAVLHQSALVG